MNNSRVVKECQICGSAQLESVLFLGFVPPVNAMPLIGELPAEGNVYPLELLRCAHCTLVQVGFEVDQQILFPPHIPTAVVLQKFSARILRIWRLKLPANWV